VDDKRLAALARGADVGAEALALPRKVAGEPVVSRPVSPMPTTLGNAARSTSVATSGSIVST